MTRNTNVNGYTELDIMLLRAGAPTRFDSPYWTKREVNWGALLTAIKSGMKSAANTIRNTIPTGQTQAV